MDKLITARSQQEGHSHNSQSEGAWPLPSNAMSASTHELRERKGDISLIFQVEMGTQP